MKRILVLGAIPVVVIVAALIALPALAAPKAASHQLGAKASLKGPSLFALEHRHGTSSQTLSPASGSGFSFSCAQPDGNEIIDVTEYITNDVDSGTAGNYWAYDTVTRRIQVWNVGPDSFCATVMYTKASSFQAVAGQTSPGKTGTLTGDEYGSFHGGYVATFTGQLDIVAPATWPAHGKINGGQPINYQCDINANCPGYVDWSTQYFANIASFNEYAWGWIYNGRDSADHSSTGTWVNSSTGNSGDILDVD